MTLEPRYRAALRWYPARWRRQNADVVIGTLLDEADAAGRKRPQRAELLSLAVNGMRTRLGVPLAATAEVRDRVSAIGYGGGLVLGLVMLVGSSWAPWDTGFVGWQGDPVTMIGPFASTSAGLYLAWIASAVAALLRRPAIAGALSVVVVLCSFATWLLGLDDRIQFPGIITIAIVAAAASVGSRPARRRRVLLSAALSLGMLFLAAVFSFHTWLRFTTGGAVGPRIDPLGWWYSVADPAWWFIAAMIVAIATLVVARNRDWAIAAIVVAARWLLLMVLLLVLSPSQLFSFEGGATLAFAVLIAIIASPLARGRVTSIP